MKFFTVALMVLLALAATCCKENEKNVSANIIDHATMVDFLTEEYLYEGHFAMVSNYQMSVVDSELTACYDSLMRKYNITPQMVDSSMAYYMLHADEYEEIQREVLQRLSEWH